MGENTHIQWARHTFNPWMGCTKVSPACANCYAEIDTPVRVLRAQGVELWGDQGARRRTSAANWRQPLKWNRAAAKAGVRERVFCASLADWLEDRKELIPIRAQLLELAGMTKHLDWMFLSKRIDGWRDRMAEVVEHWKKQPYEAATFLAEDLQGWIDGELWPSNFWIGATVENQEQANRRIPALLEIPAALRFLSCEPLLGHVTIEDYLPRYGCGRRCHHSNNKADLCGEGGIIEFPAIGWAIIGGESGPKARPMNTDHLISLRDQCLAAGVPVFIKQMGNRVAEKFRCRDPKGGDISEWPAEYRLRQFPQEAR